MYKTKGLKNSRIEVADALRGLAVIGIILYHSVEHFNIGGGPTSLSLPFDGTVFNILTVLLSGKMYGIFALLFGLSFFIMRDNQEQKGKDFSLRFAWRMVLLFGFGVLNLVFYNGDILTFYALMGLLMIPAGYLSTPALWVLTIFLLIQPVEIYSLISGWKPDISAMGGYFGAMGKACQDGTFLEAAGASLRYGFLSSLLWFVWKGRITQTIGLFFLGILFGRQRLFYNEGNHLKIWRVVLCVTVVLIAAGIAFGHWSHGEVNFGKIDSLLHPLFNLAILLFIVSGVTLLWLPQEPFAYMFLRSHVVDQLPDVIGFRRIRLLRLGPQDEQGSGYDLVAARRHSHSRAADSHPVPVGQETSARPAGNHLAQTYLVRFRIIWKMFIMRGLKPCGR